MSWDAEKWWEDYENKMKQEYGEKEWEQFKEQYGRKGRWENLKKQLIQEEQEAESEWHKLYKLLQPKKEGEKLTVDLWERSTPPENKLELGDGAAVWGGRNRDKLLLALLYNTGLEHFLRLLSDEAKEELQILLDRRKKP